MRHLIIFILAIIPFISSCEKDIENDSNTQIREIAWSCLSDQDKSRVIIDYKKAPITETIYQEKSTFAVSFKTSDDALLGPIIVYIDKTSLIVIGQGLRM